MGSQKHMHQGQIVTTSSRDTRKRVLLGVLVVVLLIGTNAGLFLWGQRLLHEARQQTNTERQNKEALQEKVRELEAGTAQAGSSTTTQPRLTTTVLQAILNNKNYTALQPYLADSVMVIMAASEGVGERTPSQAVSDLAILDAATTPWNFVVEEQLLSEWQSGDYKQYFPEGALVGRTSNNYVLSLQLNSEGKVKTIFISPDASLL